MQKKIEDDLSHSSSPMTTVQSTVRWLESSLQSPQGFRIPFESSQNKTSLPSSSPSATSWPWPPCWPPCWPGGYWGRPGPGPGPHIYFIVWSFQIGRAASDKEKVKICLFQTSIVCWAEQDVEALKNKGCCATKVINLLLTKSKEKVGVLYLGWTLGKLETSKYRRFG